MLVTPGIPHRFQLAGSTGDLVQRRLGDINPSRINQWLHVTVEERQQQHLDVRAVRIRVGHNDDFGKIAVLNGEFRPDAGTDRRNDGPVFVVLQNIGELRFLRIHRLTLQWQNRLDLRIAPLLRRTSGRIAFHDK
ncbi:hypothetical protein D3C81_1393480 [compost metagenome]